MFDYVLQRIRDADLLELPFPHLHLDDLFTADDFERIVRCTGISVPRLASDDALLDRLFADGYKVIGFPGSVTDRARYVEWRRTRRRAADTHTACEGFGMTLRLIEPRSDVLRQLTEFLGSDRFNAALAQRFGIDLAATFVDCGIQKYLDGYEISPHPDNRNKALTYMVNVNPHPDAERLDHHTHYMRFKPAYDYVGSFWENNPQVDRCWVPWAWCDTVSIQRRNNSMVVFAPSDRTMHAVRASYQHLDGQRTQLYGNLWYRDAPALEKVEWERLDLRSPLVPPQLTLRKLVAARLPASLKDALRRLRQPADRHVIPSRLRRPP